MADSGAEVTFHGPLFASGGVAARGRALENELAEDLAKEGLRAVRDELRPGHGVRSGAFEASLRIGGTGGLRVVYSPDAGVASWLEGVSSRNSRTRFRGYRMFARASTDVDRRAVALAQRAVDSYVGGLR